MPLRNLAIKAPSTGNRKANRPGSDADGVTRPAIGPEVAIVKLTVGVAPAIKEIVAGLKLQLAPRGNPEQENEMPKVKDPSAATVP